MAGLGIVSREKTDVTVDSLIGMFPAKKATITEKTVELINDAQNDPMFNGDEFIKNMQTYQNVMMKNSASIKDYINAVKFCAYLESEDDNYTEAYKRARANDEFVMARVAAPTDSVAYRELTNAASRYRKTPLVKDILTQADMPLHLMFQGGRFQMAQVLMDEALTAPYSKDRINAADKFLTHVKPPENAKIELDIGVAKDSIIDRYEDMITQLVGQQKDEIRQGGDLKTITNVAIVKENIIDGEIE